MVNLSTIAYVEATPDTLVTLTTGERLHVRESVQEVVDRAVAYQQRLIAPAPLRAGEDR